MPLTLSNSLYNNYNMPYKVSTGSKHTCAIDNKLNTYCWGYNANNECSVPINDYMYKPLVYDMHAMEHTCIILINNRLVCFGSNIVGQLDVPMDLMVTGVEEVASGLVFTCAVTLKGRVNCWGDLTYDT